MLDKLALWLATYALHSTLLLLSAWWLARAFPAARERLWRLALFGGLLTASLHAGGWLPRVVYLELPGLTPAAGSSAAMAPEPRRASDHGEPWPGCRRAHASRRPNQRSRGSPVGVGSMVPRSRLASRQPPAARHSSHRAARSRAPTNAVVEPGGDRVAGRGRGLASSRWGIGARGSTGGSLPDGEARAARRCDCSTTSPVAPSFAVECA